MNKLAPEQEMMYVDLLETGLITPDFIAHLIELSHVDAAINPNGTEVELVDAEERHVASFRFDDKHIPPLVYIAFAGCKIDVELDRFSADVRDYAAPTAG